MLTDSDIKAILTLIARSSINGAEAETVTQLQQKLQQMLRADVQYEAPLETNKNKDV